MCRGRVHVPDLSRDGAIVAERVDAVLNATHVQDAVSYRPGIDLHVACAAEDPADFARRAVDRVDLAHWFCGLALVRPHIDGVANHVRGGDVEADRLDMPALGAIDHVDRVEAAVASREVTHTVDDRARLRGDIVRAVPAPDGMAGR